MNPTRAEIEDEIERLLSILNSIDGDPDYEPEPTEEQHDTEADVTWNNGVAPHWFIIAERAKKPKTHR